MFGIPLFPLGSYFVQARLEEQFDAPAVEMIEAFPIRLNLKSVLVGMFLGVSGFSVSLMVLVCSPLLLDTNENPVFFAVPALAALSSPVGLVLRRTASLHDAKRLRLLKATGTSALPEFLPPEVRARVRQGLEAAPRPNDPDWRHALLAYGGSPRARSANQAVER